MDTGRRLRDLARAMLLVVACALTANTSPAEGLTRHIESRFGAYHAEITLQAGAGRYPELNGWQATVLDSAGRVLYRLERQVPFDTPYPALALSDDRGAGVVLNAFDGIVEFIDERGATLRRWRPFASETPSHERILKCSVAGSRVAFLASDPLESRALLHAMTIEGTLRASAALAERQAGELYLSDDGEVIVAGGSTPSAEITVSTSILDWEGRLLDTAAIDFRLADLPSGSTTVLLADTRGVLAIDLESGTRRRLWTEERPEAFITALRSAEPGAIVVSQTIEYRPGPPVYAGTRIVLIGPSGLIRLDRRLEGESADPAEAEYTGGKVRVTLGKTTTSLSFSR